MKRAGFAWVVCGLMLAAQPQAPRPVRGSLAAEVAAADRAVWFAYVVAAVPGERHSCCYDSHCGWGCRLDNTVNGEWCPASSSVAPAPEKVAMLEGFREAYIYVKAEAKQVARVRNFTPDCRVDAGDVPVVWLSGVTARQSVAFLRGLGMTSAIDALGVHSGPEADAALEELTTSSSHPDKLRQKAAFWLGSTRKQHGADVLAGLIRQQAISDRLREQLVFALSRSREGVAVLIDLVGGKDKKVRDKAVFWLARSDEAEARRFIEGVLLK